MLKEIKRYPGYFINESGIIVDSKFNQIRPNYDKYGYGYVYIEDNLERIDKLVAECYLVNSNNYQNICHRNNDILDNHVSNLYWSNDPEIFIQRRSLENDKYITSRKKQYIYEIYNDNEVIQCVGREELANKIQYEIISLKNMIGNGRKISLGPYKGYQIRRLDYRIEV